VVKGWLKGGEENEKVTFFFSFFFFFFFFLFIHTVSLAQVHTIAGKSYIQVQTLCTSTISERGPSIPTA
jgi:hypothetical protein